MDSPIDSSFREIPKKEKVSIGSLLLFIFITSVISTLLFRVSSFVYEKTEVTFQGHNILSIFILITASCFSSLLFLSKKYSITNTNIFLLPIFSCALTFNLNTFYLIFYNLTTFNADDFVGMTLLGGGLIGGISGCLIFIFRKKLK